MAKKASTSTTRKSTSSRAKTSTTRTRSTATRKTSATLQGQAEEPSEQKQTPDVPAAETALRKRAFIEAVVLRSGVKKRDAKPAVEAALSILGETLVKGQELNLPELGKVKIQNQKSVEGAHVINLRLRRKLGSAEDANAESDTGGLAEAAE